MKIRCKMKVTSVVKHDTSTTLTMEPVGQNTGDAPSEENKRYWDATPAGKMDLQFTAEKARISAGKMKAGDYYYLDIIKCRD